MRFVVDNQLPFALARWLNGQGVMADHVMNLGWDRAKDTEIWSRCVADGMIVVSKDDDFMLLARRSFDTGRLLWVRLGNCRTTALLAKFTVEWPMILSAFASGQRVVELR